MRTTRASTIRRTSSSSSACWTFGSWFAGERPWLFVRPLGEVGDVRDMGEVGDVISIVGTVGPSSSDSWPPPLRTDETGNGAGIDAVRLESMVTCNECRPDTSRAVVLGSMWGCVPGFGLGVDLEVVDAEVEFELDVEVDESDLDPYLVLEEEVNSGGRASARLFSSRRLSRARRRWRALACCFVCLG